MNRVMKESLAPKPEALFARVVSILEQARGYVVRAVNSQMVQAYGLIGCEIVQRATYGKKLIDALSAQLTQRYGQAFSPTTLQYFRKFYLADMERCAEIPRAVGVESSGKGYTIRSPLRSTPLTIWGWQE